MKRLLDTHLLWAAGSPDQLSAEARPLLEEPLNELLFSADSFWEIAIKRGLGWTFRFSGRCRALRRGLLDNGYQELAISSEHAVSIDNLPPPSIKTRLIASLLRRLLLKEALADSGCLSGEVSRIGASYNSVASIGLKNKTTINRNNVKTDA